LIPAYGTFCRSIRRFAILGGYGAALLVRGGESRWMPAAGLLLMGWVAADSVLVHPDYLAYFNPIASPHPEKVLCESDLDWGRTCSVWLDGCDPWA